MDYLLHFQNLSTMEHFNELEKYDQMFVMFGLGVTLLVIVLLIWCNLSSAKTGREGTQYPGD